MKINKLGLVPSFVGADGYELTECIAIAIYSMSCFLIYTALFAAPFYDEETFIYSYPCLKTVVETYSHSDKLLLLRDLLIPQAFDVYYD